MLRELPILFVQIKTGSSLTDLKRKISQIIYLPYKSKEIK